MIDESILEELGRFDQEYLPQPGRRPGLDSLDDGDYDFEIAEAQFDRTEKTREALLKVLLRITSGPSSGQMVEHVYFFRNQENVDRLGAELVTLGLPADRWTTARGARFSVELARNLSRLQGVRFRGRKTTFTKRDGGLGHGLNINIRLAGASVPPAGPVRSARSTPVPAQPPAPAYSANGPAPATGFGPTSSSYSDDDIPF